MHHRVALPRRLGERFSVRAAAAAGILPDRCRAADLHRPYRGVRSLAVPETFQDHLDCYLPRMKPGQRFGGITAARDWGLPVPTRWRANEPLLIVVPPTGAPPKAKGVRGRRLRVDRAETVTLK